MIWNYLLLALCSIGYHTHLSAAASSSSASSTADKSSSSSSTPAMLGNSNKPSIMVFGYQVDDQGAANAYYHVPGYNTNTCTQSTHIPVITNITWIDALPALLQEENVEKINQFIKNLDNDARYMGTDITPITTTLVKRLEDIETFKKYVHIAQDAHHKNHTILYVELPSINIKLQAITRDLAPLMHLREEHKKEEAETLYIQTKFPHKLQSIYHDEIEKNISAQQANPATWKDLKGFKGVHVIFVGNNTKNEREVLLIRTKSQHGLRHFDAVGGKPDRHETVYEALERELQEELLLFPDILDAVETPNTLLSGLMNAINETFDSAHPAPFSKRIMYNYDREAGILLQVPLETALYQQLLNHLKTVYSKEKSSHNEDLKKIINAHKGTKETEQIATFNLAQLDSCVQNNTMHITHDAKNNYYLVRHLGSGLMPSTIKTEISDYLRDILRNTTEIPGHQLAFCSTQQRFGSQVSPNKSSASAGFKSQTSPAAASSSWRRSS